MMEEPADEERIVVWRLDDGPAHAPGVFECSGCSWGGKRHKTAARKHARSVHNCKVTLQRKTPRQYKMTEEVRGVNRRDQRRHRSRLKVSFALEGVMVMVMLMIIV